MFETDIIDAHKVMIDRYIGVIEKSSIGDKNHWLSYCQCAKLITNSDKLSRWVGFLQGVMVSRELITVEDERNFSRKIYKPIYEKYGKSSETIDVPG